MYSLYSILLAVALVISAPWWLLEMLRHGKYRIGWRERLGSVPDRLFNQEAVNTIWIHAVSVGEVLAISRVVEELKAQLPGWRIVVSTTTDTGQKLARERFGENNVFYVPLDLPFAVRAYLQALRPEAAGAGRKRILAEPAALGATLRRSRCRGKCPSLRPFAARLFAIQKTPAPVLQNVQLFLAQSEEDARRLVQIGAPADRVHVSGNLKFEVKPSVGFRPRCAIHRRA